MEQNFGKQSSKIYSVGIYSRLSVDSHDQKNESIETQTEIAMRYMEQQHDMVLHDCYSDRGETGTNFEREGFKCLMADVRLHKVDCIIVKDFSRFGRNYIEMGNYIQKVFPLLGVRFISVTDNFDSFADKNDDVGMNLKNLVNEMYSRDVSAKVRISKRAQWEKGSFTGGAPPYGYRTETINGKRCLIIEKKMSNIVKEIYRLYESGKTMKNIVAWLYEAKIYRPADYRKYGHIYYKEHAEEEELKEWNTGSIKTILTNPVYIGCLVRGKNIGKRNITRNKPDIAERDYDVKEQTHEAIISDEQFFHVAERFEEQLKYSNKREFSEIIPHAENIFDGILFCGECDKCMSRVCHIKTFHRGDRMRRYSYFCKNSKKVNGHICQRKYITQDSLTNIVKAVLNQEFLLSGMIPNQLVEKSKENAEKQKVKQKKKCNDLQNKIERQIGKESEQYMLYRIGELSKADFLKLKEENEKMIYRLKDNLEDQNKVILEMDAAMDEQNHFIRALLKFNKYSELSGDFLKAHIQKIRVYPGKRIEITFHFARKDIILA